MLRLYLFSGGCQGFTRAFPPPPGPLKHSITRHSRTADYTLPLLSGKLRALDAGSLRGRVRGLKSPPPVCFSLCLSSWVVVCEQPSVCLFVNQQTQRQSLCHGFYSSTLDGRRNHVAQLVKPVSCLILSEH